MTVMTGAARRERLGRSRRRHDPADDLFETSLVVSQPHPRTRRQRIGDRVSLVAHVADPRGCRLRPDLHAGRSCRTRAIAGSSSSTRRRPRRRPCRRAARSSQQQAKPETPKPVTENKPKPEFTAPIETPQPQETAKIEPEAGVRPEDQFGSETGSDFGDPLGMEEGVEGGVVGGVPGGVLGGVLGGTGTGPVMDYDSPPRPIKITRPQYPQEAFVKKIEGTVVVEILIDSQGRVVRARVIQSVPLLDAAALQTVYQWVFQPAVKHGRPGAPRSPTPPVAFRIY